jgi:hypothetical protein
MTHTLDPQLLERPIRILVVGCGGNGSAIVAARGVTTGKLRREISFVARIKITKSETREFTHIGRRFATIILLEQRLDGNYTSMPDHIYVAAVILRFSRQHRQVPPVATTPARK